MAPLPWRDTFWDGKRKPFVIAITGAAVMLTCLFLANLSYLYGTAFENESRAKGLNILAIDYDGGVIGQSLAGAYSALQGDEFPTLNFHSASEYATASDVQNAVCKGDYWAAIVAQDGASNRLAAALGGGTTAARYNATNTLTYIYNSVHYPTAQQGYILSNMQTLIGAAGGVYNSLNGTKAVASPNTSDPSAMAALLNPIQASSIDIMPTSQGGRAFLNTISMVFPILQQFFFLMTLNGISNQFNIYGHLHNRQVGLMRMVVSIIYTFIASLTVAGYLWAFRESWGVNGNQFVLTWITFWLYMHINFLVMDTATAFIPLSFISFFVLTWVIISVASTIFPFELSPGFYRWGYALPAHNVITILFQIWSGGCNNQLARALPVLFGWEIFAMVGAVAGSFYRNRIARRAVMKEEENSEGYLRTTSTVGTMNDNDEVELMQVRTAVPGLPMPFMGSVYTEPKLKRTGTV